MSRNLRFALLFTICALVYIMSYFHRVTPTILSMDLMADFHISAGELGLFSSAAMLAYGLMQLPSGMLADLFGGKNTLILLCLLSGAGTMAFAATHSMNGAFVARFIVGTGAAVTVPLITVLAVWCPPELFVRSSAVIFSMAGIGGVLAAPPVYFLSSIMGWRLTMAVFGAFSLLLAVLVCLCIPGRRNAAAPSCARTDLRALMKGAVTVFRSPVFRTLGIWYMMLVGSAYCMTTLWWGPYLMQGCGLSQSAASTAMSVISLGVMAAFLLLGWLADSVVRDRKRLLIGCTLVCAASLLVLVAFGPKLSPWLTTLAAAVFSGTASATGPVTYAIMKDSYPSSMTGTAVGIINMTFPVWSSLLQYLYGGVYTVMSESTHGLPHSFALSIILLNCLISLLFIRKLPLLKRTV